MIDYEQFFNEKFWPVYPKKQAKQDALKAWLSFCKKEKPDEKWLENMINDLIIRKVTDKKWVKDNGEYIPLPATFIRQRRWDDLWRLPLPPVEETFTPEPIEFVLRDIKFIYCRECSDLLTVERQTSIEGRCEKCRP